MLLCTFKRYHGHPVYEIGKRVVQHYTDIAPSREIMVETDAGIVPVSKKQKTHQGASISVVASREEVEASLSSKQEIDWREKASDVKNDYYRS